ncbi:MAG: DUF493 domain-containing protein [Gammaproteobacteria bacterium]|nr:DUF493 domain-containing protein [Gammaproteobacteria bacterium]
MSDDPKDGFDLIEYPTDFAFKAMCKADDKQPAQEHIKGLILPLLDDEALLDISGNVSKTGKFESVTLKIRINSRDELESIYKHIANSPRVVMTL